MALFPGVPDNAVRAAIDLQHKIREYNLERQAKGRVPIKAGTGLHTGSLMLGILGESERMQSSVISDDVNLASRLEGVTRLYGATIVISESTLAGLQSPEAFQYRFVDRVRLKGKEKPIRVYEVFDGDSPDQVELKSLTKAEFEVGLELYKNKQFAEASVKFNQVLQENPQDKVAKLNLKRSARYMVDGVPDDWSAIETLTEK